MQICYSKIKVQNVIFKNIVEVFIIHMAMCIRGIVKLVFIRIL